VTPPISPRLCHWKGCGPSRNPPIKANVVINFDTSNPLVPDGEDREYYIDVPVCNYHWFMAEDTKRCELAYHPSQGKPTFTI
jgi:hypothetical protein